MNGTHPRILVVEDEEIVALDLEETLRSFDYEVLPTASSANKAIAAISNGKPDLVLMDIGLHGSADGVDAARIMREQFCLPVIFVTAHSDSATIERARATAPYGFVTKPWNARQLEITISIALAQHVRLRSVSDGGGQIAGKSLADSGYRLTPRQSEIIKLIASGKSNTQMAALLNVSLKTVNFHKGNLMDCLGVRTTAELTRFALRYGLASL